MSNNQQETLIKPISNNSITTVVIDNILHAISEGLLKAGERIPSEPKLASQIGVSRNTIREAINILVEKGLLYKQRGIGTFISSQSQKLIRANLTSVLGTSKLMRAQNRIPGQNNFTWREEVPSDQILESLGLQAGSPVMHISRLRTSNGNPVIQSNEYIPMGIPNLNYEFSEVSKYKNWSMYEYFAEFGYEVNSVVTHVHAISASEEIATSLCIKENEAVLQLKQIHYSNNILYPIMYAINYHNDKSIDTIIVRVGLGAT